MVASKVQNLQAAQSLETPQRESMLRRDSSVQYFWEKNRDLLATAWKEWEIAEDLKLPNLDSSLIDKRLRDTVTQAWEDPTTERDVQELLEEVAPGVFAFQFFDPEQIVNLRKYLEKAWDSQIPLRPPYGIVLNRGGAMLDARSAGHLGAPSFQALYQEILTKYMRPIARLLYPDIAGYDSQTFGFSIAYQTTTDTSIRPHTDASSVTLNINANLPEESFTGSTVDFFDLATGQATSLAFTPGSAMIHRGSAMHTAQPITSGERTNLVLWLYGNNGQVAPQHPTTPPTKANDRWGKPDTEPDSYAPF